ncbi:MAG: PTS sugar transporter subunit IIA [Candidatus Omnitrophica bacterium]|nr:PTS sugar transporter subunit IIA [Candidatus Omnitrophota bacterium]
MDINILNYLDKDSIVFDFKDKSKRVIFSSLLDHLILKKKIAKRDKNSIIRALIQREDMGSTAIGGHIAFPHTRVASVKKVVLCLAVSNRGIEFDALDQEPVNIVLLLLSNNKEAGLHLKMLAFLARLLRDKYFVQQLKNAKKSEEVLRLINKQQQAVKH